MALSNIRSTTHHIADTTIGRESIFIGVLTSTGNVQIDGIFEGDIVSAQHVQIRNSGRVRATLDVISCTITGSITGKVRASNDVVIESSARAWCEIESPALRIEPGAVFKGSSNGKDNDNVIF
jgi:cytoskeletal protein CcmA (bactofilin family)